MHSFQKYIDGTGASARFVWTVLELSTSQMQKYNLCGRCEALPLRSLIQGFMDQIQSYINEHKDRFLSELCDFLRIPSVSADSRYKEDVARTAAFVRDSLVAAGADHVEICPTPGHPIVYAEKIINASLPTVLVYGHYDVQPADPLELWGFATF